MDVQLILNKLAEMNLIRLGRITGHYQQLYCPFHSDGKERHPSAGVLLEKESRNGQLYEEGFFHCFTCSENKNLIEFVSSLLSLHNISSKSGLDWLEENIPGFSSSDDFEYLIPKSMSQQIVNKYALEYISQKSIAKPKYVEESELEKYRFTVPYMYERKLTDEIIQKFDVGVDLNYIPGTGRNKVPTITFPVRDINGNVLFIYRRAINTKNFFMPSGLEKPLYGIYELGSNINSLILCESIFNTLTCYVYGMPSLALFGTGTKFQIESLKKLGVKEFIIGLDPDEAGDRGFSKLKKALKTVAIVRRMDIPIGKDINDLTKEEFDIALKNRI